MKQYIINHFHIHGDYIVGSHIDHRSPNSTPHPEAEQVTAEDIEPTDTSFFCTQRFTPDIIENMYAACCHNRSELCRKLTKIFGWEVNESGLRKAESAQK